MYEKLGFSKKIIDLINNAEDSLKKQFKEIDNLCEYNSVKVLKAFWDNGISEAHFNSTTGYGYDDVGRRAIEKVFAECLGAEDALVRNQFVSGSHALTVALFAYATLPPADVAHPA